jgi:hypothetical protein
MKRHIPLDRLSNPSLLSQFRFTKHGTSTGQQVPIADETNACCTFSKRVRRWRCAWRSSVNANSRSSAAWCWTSDSSVLCSWKNSRHIFWPPAQLMEATLTLRYRRLAVQERRGSMKANNKNTKPPFLGLEPIQICQPEMAVAFT